MTIPDQQITDYGPFKQKDFCVPVINKRENTSPKLTIKKST